MRIEQLTFTRFIAAVSIVIYHYGINSFPFSHKSISYLFKAADIGVSYFFILSGFVMIIAYGNKLKVDAPGYFRNRLGRIYPVYLLALVLVTGYYLLKGWHVDAKAFGLNLFVLQAWLPPYPLSLNYTGWSLAVELFFYALFPVLFNRVYTKFKLKSVAAFVFIFWVISQLVFLLLLHSSFYQGFPSRSNDFLFHFPLLHLNQFLVGNLAGLVFRHFSFKTKNYDIWLVALVLILMVLLLVPNPRIYHNGLLAAVFVSFIFLICLNTGRISSLFRQRPFIFLGEISYGIYILQYPAFLLSQDLIKFLNINHAAIAFYLFLLCLFILSGLSFLLIETPLRNKIKSFRTAQTA